MDFRTIAQALCIVTGAALILSGIYGFAQMCVLPAGVPDLNIRLSIATSAMELIFGALFIYYGLKPEQKMAMVAIIVPSIVYIATVFAAVYLIGAEPIAYLILALVMANLAVFGMYQYQTRMTSKVGTFLAEGKLEPEEAPKTEENPQQ